MQPSTVVILAAVAVTLAACDRADSDRTTSLAPGVQVYTAPSAPVFTANAPFEAIIAGDVRVFHESEKARPLPSGRGGAPDDQEIYIRAVESAAAAPDTASADAAKKEVFAGSSHEGGNAPTAKDSAANNPRHGALTEAQEANSMPKALQANNHSSLALEADSGNPPK